MNFYHSVILGHLSLLTQCSDYNLCLYGQDSELSLTKELPPELGDKEI